ncbi:MAG TPA: SRPBCC family protein [Miltoncostaeaceae bacterium]|nr:SRPBCC family protein [Miltoncostaeaceae bacterium]
MAEITETVDVKVPVRVAYDQWTQFEQFPRFMEGVREVRQIDDTHLHWAAEIAGRTQEWDAEITSQIPDQHIAWRSTGGFQNTGDVRFESLGDDLTRVIVHMQHDPQGALEQAGDALGLARRRVKGDLERFREMIESRDEASGSWRGTVQDGEVESSSPGDAEGDPNASIGPEGYSESTRLPSLSRLKGADVCDRSGEKLGEVSDVYLDSNAEYVRYLEVKTGWTGRSSGLVPIDDVDFEDRGGKNLTLIVPYTKDQIRNSPTLDDDAELTPEREQEIYRHYERSGYWEEARRAIDARQTTPAPTPTIAEAEAADLMRRGENPEKVRVKRWGM